MSDKSLITFIIPTVGRKTLVNTLKSLQLQSDSDWKAIIVFDAVAPEEEAKAKIESDPRFKSLILPTKAGRNHNSAGLVRNLGMQQVDTEWIGFVDDDDILSELYVRRLKEELSRTQDADCVIFRMMTNNTILPPPHHTNFVSDQVGISFSYKRQVFLESLQFIPNSREDFNLLNRIRASKKKIVLSRHITYIVRKDTIPKNLDELEQNNATSIIN